MTFQNTCMFTVGLLLEPPAKYNLQFCGNLRLKTIFYYTCITMPHTLVSVRLPVVTDGCPVIKESAMRLTCFAYSIEDVL